MKKYKKNYISVYVRNSEQGASCYYRITQYIKNIDGNFKLNSSMSSKMFRINLDFQGTGIKKRLLQGLLYMIMLLRVTSDLLYDCYHHPKKIIISRQLLPHYMPHIVMLILKRVLKETELIWDFDDYIFMGEISRRESKALTQHSKKIVVTSEFLKNTLPHKMQDKVIILPTTDGDMLDLDFDNIMNKRRQLYQNELRLIWVGTDSNLVNVRYIIEILDETAGEIKELYNKGLRLVVVCNKPLTYISKHLEIENVKWSRKRAIIEMEKAHVGIMPLIDNQYNLGKGGFKLIQFMAVRLPIIASDVGYNQEVVKEGIGFLIKKENIDLWRDKIKILSHDYNLWIKYSDSTELVWKKYFSYENNLLIWKKLINS